MYSDMAATLIERGTNVEDLDGPILLRYTAKRVGVKVKDTDDKKTLIDKINTILAAKRILMED